MGSAGDVDAPATQRNSTMCVVNSPRMTQMKREPVIEWAEATACPRGTPLGVSASDHRCVFAFGGEEAVETNETLQVPTYS